MKIYSINPRTDKVIKEFDETPLAKVYQAIERAKKAQKMWANRKREERIAILLKLKKIIDREKNEIAELVYKEAGFNKGETLGEITGDILLSFESHLVDYEKVQTLDYSTETSTAKVKFIPLGVVGQIGIWNYPFWQTFITAIPALLVGNAIIYKLSEYTTMTGLKMAELIWEAGVPKDVFIPILGGPKVGQELVKSNVDMIVFTGGSKTGLDIIKEAKTKPLLLELSGNDAAIICHDCDMELTVKGIVYGSFLHSGEVCTRIKRIFIMKTLAEEFIDRFIKGTEKLTIEAEISPLIRKEALEKVDDQVKEAIDLGAELLLGGEKFIEEGYFYKPTILFYKDSKRKMYKEEIFGPVVQIQVVEDEREAIVLANETRYGLGATIWSTDIKKAETIADQLEVGMVWINDSNAAIPGGVYYGGVKASGIANSQNRVKAFMKKKMLIENDRLEIKEWW